MLGKYQVNAIVAMGENRVIGCDNKLPWRLPQDMKRFAELTTGHTVLIGRKTFESLPDKYRPLPNRKNIVLSRTATEVELGAVVCESLEVLESRLASGELRLPSSQIWVIGGAQIYDATRSLWDRLFLTRVSGQFKGDAFFSFVEQDFLMESSESFDQGTFEVYSARLQ